MLNSYRIIDSTRYKIPDNLCFTSDKPLKDVKHMIYYILYVGLSLQTEAIARRDFVIGSSEEPLGESVCYLLQEFYGCELMAYQNFSIPIDLYCLWNWSRSDPHIDKRNGLWIGRTRRKPLPGDWFDIIEKKCFVPGLAARMTQILRGDIVPYKMNGFPWSEEKSTALVVQESGEIGGLQNV